MRINDIRAGTWTGAICSIWASINFGELLQTVIMAAAGTLVSYVISKLLHKNQKR